MRNLIRKWFWFLIFSSWMVSSCTGLPPVMETGQEKPSLGLTPSKDSYPLSRFPDIPLPSGFEFDRSTSFLYGSGSGSVKVGRLFFKGWASQEKVITFFENEMINNGWVLVRVVEHNGTMLLYEKEDRVCTLLLSSSLGKTTVEIQIGPK